MKACIRYCDVCSRSTKHKQRLSNGTLLWDCNTCYDDEKRLMLDRIKEHTDDDNAL